MDKATIKKFTDNHIHTVERLRCEPLKNLVAISGISENKAKKAQEEAFKFLGGVKIVTAAEHLTKLNTTPVRQRAGGRARACMRARARSARAARARCAAAQMFISTGASELDTMLGGGIVRGHLTQVYGEFRSGKSMLAHTLCVTAQKPAESGGGNGRALFIDTEGTFDPHKLVAIARAHGLDEETAINNIDMARSHNYEDLNMIINDATALLADGIHSLIVIDSIAAPFRNEFLGRGELSVRQQELQRTLTLLQKAVTEFNVACLVTNQVMANPEGGGIPGADPRRPVLGHVLAHRTQEIMYMKKGAADKRIIKLIQSSCRPSDVDAEARVSASGFCDVEGGK